MTFLICAVPGLINVNFDQDVLIFDHVGHETLREPATPSDPARQARRDIAVNVDQRF
jgi:hypothetical protein